MRGNWARSRQGAGRARPITQFVVVSAVVLVACNPLGISLVQTRTVLITVPNELQTRGKKAGAARPCAYEFVPRGMTRSNMLGFGGVQRFEGPETRVSWPVGSALSVYGCNNDDDILVPLWFDYTGELKSLENVGTAHGSAETPVTISLTEAEGLMAGAEIVLGPSSYEQSTREVRNRLETAVAAARTAVKHAPSSARAYWMLARAFDSIGEPQAALDAFAKAATLSASADATCVNMTSGVFPGQARALSDYADALRRADRESDAMLRYRDAESAWAKLTAEASPQECPVDWANHAIALARQGRENDSQVQKVLTTNDSDANTALIAHWVSTNSGELHALEALQETAVSHNADVAYWQISVTALLARKGKPAGVVAAQVQTRADCYCHALPPRLRQAAEGRGCSKQPPSAGQCAFVGSVIGEYTSSDFESACKIDWPATVAAIYLGRLDEEQLQDVAEYGAGFAVESLFYDGLGLLSRNQRKAGLAKLESVVKLGMSWFGEHDIARELLLAEKREADRR